ncbi:uncharacterized protein PAE49_013144 isoform 2-T3 [Odontesthes bonariensis]|uniref:uncharacterized protein LOC142396822 isoform X2 n=1 Tax=Odontesthes bonariensis TaxID=219752 RepID=UPI003F581123
MKRRMKRDELGLRQDEDAVSPRDYEAGFHHILTHPDTQWGNHLSKTYLVKATIQQHRGDFDAAETACAELELDRDELTPTPSSTSRKRPKDPDSALLESLQSRIVESGTILKGLAKAEQQPIAARTAFANYVRDSLVNMPNAKYKKAKLTINRLMYDLMNEDSDDGISNTMGAPLIPATQQPSHLQQPALHPSSAPSIGSFRSSSPSPSEQYQPPHMWRNVPPASSVWGSQSMEYMQQYQQQPFQHPQQQMPPQRLYQMMPAKEPAQQQQKCTPTPTPVSASLSAAANVLTDQQTPTQLSPDTANEHSLTSISGLSNLWN